MEYREMIQLKDGRVCILRNGTEKDALGMLDNFIRTHEETDWLHLTTCHPKTAY